MLRWLNRAGVDHVLVGAVARAARGDRSASGPVAIVPAPYGRNLDRLAHALNAVHARERFSVAMLGTGGSAHVGGLKFTAARLLRPACWMLSCGAYELDIEGRSGETPSYQELLYEAVRIELASGVSAEVAAPEDIEYYDHLRRTGVAPEMVVSRAG